MRPAPTGAGAQRARRRASRGVSPPAASLAAGAPGGRHPPAQRPPRRGGEKAGSRAASSLAPSLNASVLHLMRPGCGLLNHPPRNRAAARAEPGVPRGRRSGGKGARGVCPAKTGGAPSRALWLPRHL